MTPTVSRKKAPSANRMRNISLTRARNREIEKAKRDPDTYAERLQKICEAYDVAYGRFMQMGYVFRGL